MIMVHECNDIANDVLNNKKTVNAYNQFLKLHHAYYGVIRKSILCRGKRKSLSKRTQLTSIGRCINVDLLYIKYNIYYAVHHRLQ